MEKLKRVKDIFTEIQNVSSIKAKEYILKQNADNELFKECLKFLLDSNIVSGLSTKKMNKDVLLVNETFGDIRDAFKYLQAHNTGTSHDIAIIKSFCYFQGELEEFCKDIFTKKLKLGISDKITNKIFPNLISTSEGSDEIKPALASKFDFEKPPKGEMFISEKLDGIRANVVIRNGVVNIYSRQGKLIEGLKYVEEDLLRLGLRNTFLDGELIAKDCSYEEVYKETTKRVKNKNAVKKGVKLVVFDILPLDEFDNKICTDRYYMRRIVLDDLDLDIKKSTVDNVEVLPILYDGDDMEEVIKLLDKYRDLGAEGLMCNLDEVYEFKRTKKLLKLKVMQTCDLRVIGFEMGQGRLNGTLGKIICDYKGNELGVGSGFSDDMRSEIWNNQDKYLHKIVEVSYFEETNNDKGDLSLRFPIFKGFRFDKDEVSYE